MTFVESAAISSDIDRLQSELANLRARMEDDTSSFSTLEQQVTELRERLKQTQENVRAHEARLAEKRAELAEAKHLESLAAYRDSLGKYHEARKALSKAATSFLAEVDAFDRQTASLHDLLEEMRGAFGDDERVVEVAAALADERAELSGSWEAVAAALRGRTDELAAGDDATGPNGDLPAELHVRAEEVQRRARILEYFGKS
jgi:predicted  nucleic acid-binding Zn-ribbon protein